MWRTAWFLFVDVVVNGANLIVGLAVAAILLWLVVYGSVP